MLLGLLALSALVLAPGRAASEGRRAPAKQDRAAGDLARGLCRLGYSKPVAQKIVAADPSLARAIFAQKSRPHRLYRGVDIDPRKTRFDPRFYSTDPVGKLCMTDDPCFAIGYAIGYPETRMRRGERQGVMLELEVPSLLLEDPRARLVLRADQSRMPDVTPFLRRFGVINLATLKHTPSGDVDERAAVRSIRWSKSAPP